MSGGTRRAPKPWPSSLGRPFLFGPRRTGKVPNHVRRPGSPVRIDTAILALILTAASASGQNIIPREQTYRRSVQSGQELRVFTYARRQSDCSPSELPRIVVRRQPAHGTVSLRAGPTTVCPSSARANRIAWAVPIRGWAYGTVQRQASKGWTNSTGTSSARTMLRTPLRSSRSDSRRASSLAGSH